MPWIPLSGACSYRRTGFHFAGTCASNSNREARMSSIVGEDATTETVAAEFPHDVEGPAGRSDGCLHRPSHPARSRERRLQDLSARRYRRHRSPSCPPPFPCGRGQRREQIRGYSRCVTPTRRRRGRAPTFEASARPSQSEVALRLEVAEALVPVIGRISAETSGGVTARIPEGPRVNGPGVVGRHLLVLPTAGRQHGADESRQGC